MEYDRGSLSRGGEMKAAGIAAAGAVGVGVAVWYLARLFLQRERVEEASAPAARES
ncbi:hypothetical protein [Longimicrobium terrae]|jgi:hypothetical protein|uniref:Uncharacterized protein n=1 Tax=Longimicrobium terrae TaxID=1639882 RepID=A0A841H351_9BACT|nr:hypothetical protein [Longimicrobium terrae]MBB4638058.1 hypothetical protein [Longimicrobium terrae]MBB6072430.1 hypothetical protein [Longimicrobium terrae]NNC32156.1 hypothetical protein [Longimicrobium terrae]